VSTRRKLTHARDLSHTCVKMKNFCFFYVT